MNMFSSKSLKVIIAMIALAFGPYLSSGAQTLAAQLDDKDIPLSEFNSIYVGDNFEVTLVRGSYGMRLTVDKELAPYVEKYVKSRTLNLSYDAKSVPKEIKKMYRGKNAAAPVFRAVISLPELESVTLVDNASLTGAEIFYADKFNLSVGDKAIVKSLSVNARNAYISTKKNCQAIVDLQVEGPVEIASDGNSSLKVNVASDDLSISTGGYSQVSVTARCPSVNVSSASSSQLTLSSRGEKISVSAEGFAKLSLSGEAEKMVLKSFRNSKLDGLSFVVKDLEVTMAGASDATISVERLLDVSLVGGSELYFSGTPEFRIGKIMRSTLAPYGTTR